MKINELFAILFRYIALVIISFPDLSLIYLVVTPLTIIPLYWILHLIDPSTMLIQGNIFVFKGTIIQIIEACTAGAAYFLLLILNLTTPMHPSKRVKSLLFLILSFLVLNIARIVIFAILLANGFQYFDFAHRLVWYFGSTIMIILLWFVNVWIFNIRAVPIYTDIKSIFDDIVPQKVDEKKEKTLLRTKVNRILNRIENKEKHNYKSTKKELAAIKAKKL
jgi:exosortase/archaeosortase family protein